MVAAGGSMDGNKIKPALRRDIGLSGSAFLAFNGIVGAGIFALPGTLAGQFGAFSAWLFLLFGVLILFIAAPLAALAGRFGISGGPVAYASAAYGPAAAFQVGWLYYLARVTSLAANSTVFVAYAGTFSPMLAAGPPRAAAILVLLGSLTAINILGVRRAVGLLDALTLLKAAPLVVMALAALVMFGDRLQMPEALPPLGTVETAALVVLYAFIGFENVLVPAAETRNAERTIPRAMLLTLGATILLYFVVQLAYVAAEPGETGADAPLVALGAMVADGAGAAVLTLAALFSLTGNLQGSLLASPRVTFALAEAGALPRWFGIVSARFHTPCNSILFMGVLGLALALTGSFVFLAVVSTLARMIVYATSISTLPVLRRRSGEPMFSGWSGASVLPGIGVCIWAMLQSDWMMWRMLIGLVAAGGLLYLVARHTATRAYAGLGPLPRQ